MDKLNDNEEVIYSGEKKYIVGLVKQYFDGLYCGDVGLLKSIFHEDVVLKSPNLRRSMNEWMRLVCSRDTPKERRDSYGFKILWVDIQANQAMVKVKCPLLEYRYIDYLGFLKEGGCWKIVSKMYAEESNAKY